MNSTGPAPASTQVADLQGALLDATGSLTAFPAERQAAREVEGRGQLFRWRAHRIAVSLRAREPLGAVLVKLYRPKNAVDGLLEVVFGNRCDRSFEMAQQLREAGLPTPEPVARARRGEVRLLATRLLPEHTLLTEHLKQRFVRPGAPGTPAEKHRLLERVGRLVQRLHQAGFAHGDLTASNIVVDGDGDLHLIDLDRTRRPVLFRRLFQTLDLRLLFLTSWGEVSRIQWLRLLAAYFDGFIGDRSVRRRMARRVLGARRGRVRLGAADETEGGRVPYERR